jgi:nucleotide-binding universal stress UspA family protein
MYKTLLVPLDGSEIAECTLAHTIEIAQKFQVPNVTLIKVNEPFNLGWAVNGELSGISGIDEKGIDEKAETESKAYLAKKAADLKQEGIKAKTVLLKGDAADQILMYSDKVPVDLIIMATHGKTGFTRWAMGSVADRIVRHSKVPVMLVPPAGCRI